MVFKHTLITCAILIPHLLSASAQDETSNQKALTTLYTVEGNIQQAYNHLVNKKIGSIGFRLSNQDKLIDDTSSLQLEDTMLDVLHLTPILRDNTILPLLNIDPRIAAFSPFNILMYKRRDLNMSYVEHLTPNVMLNILNIENDEVRRKFTSPFKALDATIAQALGGENATKDYTKLPEKTMIHYALEFGTTENINDFIVKFQNQFKHAFIDDGYIISGYHNFMDATPNAKTILSSYQAFWTYSLNHQELLHSLINTQDTKAEAAIFAPFTMYSYIKKDTNTLILGMAKLHNISDTLGIKDEKTIQLIERLDTEIPKLLEKMGMHAVKTIKPQLSKAKTETSTMQKHLLDKPTAIETKEIDNDTNQTNKHIQKIKVLNKVVEITIPSVPKVISLAFGKEAISTNRRITFSKRVPPNYIPHRFDKSLKSKSKESENTEVGKVYKGKIAAYLRGDFIDVADLKKRLKNVGFKILATAPVNKKEDLISIVFTTDSLLTLASKSNRGFIASLRALVDTKEKTISITNPLYLAKGFLQDDFDEKTAKDVLTALIKAFPKLKNSKDSLKYQLLSKYQFMNGMPKYQDMIEVASGTDLLEKIKDNKKVVFKQTLSSGATLIGIQLGKRTRKFTKRIGRNNAAMLPYPILIEDGKAKILDPKFYISYMYPMLTMSEFMTIATVPDAMVKDCEKVFK